MRRAFGWSLVMVCVVSVVVTGCADERGDASRGRSAPSDSSRSSPSAPPPGATAGDPALSAAADEVGRIVRRDYERWYAGTVLDHRAGTLTVYRKPGSDLDQEVRDRATGAALVFEDAEMSEQEMRALTRRVMADTAYWREHGITVNGAGPLQDGSGVSVMTADGTDEEATRLSRHYDSRVVVERGSAIASPAAPFTPASPVS